MVDIDTLLSWNPDGLAAVGDELNATRRSLLDLQDEIWDGRPTSTWVGEAAESARTSHDQRRDALNDLVAEIAPVIMAIDTAAGTLRTAQQDVQNARQTIMGHGWTLSTSGGRVTANPPPDAEADDAVEQAVQSAVTTIADALTDAEQADTDLAAVLRSAERNEYDGGSSTLSDAGLPPHLAALSSSELVDYFLAHPEETAPYLDQLSTNEQQWLANELTTSLERLGGYGDWADLHGDGEPVEPMTDAELTQLNAQLAAFGSHPTVSTQVLNNLGPETYLEMQENLFVPSGYFGDDGDIPSPATVGETQRQLGALLAGGTSGTTAGSPGTDGHVSSEWVDRLVEHGAATEYDTTGGPGTQDDVNGLQLLGVAAGNPGHGSYFLNELGTAVERYEAEHGQYGSPWTRMPVGDRIDFTDVARDDTSSWYDVRSDYPPQHPTGQDPMTGVMEGLSHNPQAAQDFFTGDFEGATREGELDVANRSDYYLNHRDWDPDGIGSVGGVTGVDRFGDALVAATTQDPTPASVQVAEDAVAAAGDGTAIMDHGLEEDFGTIVGAYMPDVYGAYSDFPALQSGDTDPWLPGEQAVDMRARFSVEDLDNVLNQVGTDDEALQTVFGAGSAYASYGYDYGLSGAADGTLGTDAGATWEQRIEHVQSAVNSPFADIVGAMANGRVDHGIETGILEDLQTNQANDRYWEAGGWIVEKAAGQIPVVGFVASDPVGWAVDGITGANDVDTAEVQARAEAGQYIMATDGSLQAIATDSVYRNLPPEWFQQNAPELLGSDGAPVPMAQWTDEQADTWNRLANQPGPGSSAFQVAGDLTDQFSQAITQAEQRRGEG